MNEERKDERRKAFEVEALKEAHVLCALCGINPNLEPCIANRLLWAYKRGLQHNNDKGEQHE